jgi:protein-L-isoaspartate O-methyltransferase
MTEEHYIGTELEIFAKADRWKAYFRSQIAPYFGEAVLEVGAGIGATTETLSKIPHQDWLCIEPDANLLADVDVMIAKGILPATCRTKVGTIDDLGEDPLFDTILYIDVLEHIEADRAELLKASKYLHSGGRLIVLSPAYQSLYSPFDKAIGHFRRYDRTSLSALTPPNCRIERMIYLDAVGVSLSFGNRLLLRQSTPSDKQIQFWDKRIIPVSRVIDRIIGYNAGRSIIGIWQKN